MHSNKYDPQGRIIENDQLGTISFDDNKKVYQPTSIYLNSTGNKLFNYGHIENIAYNENNDPVFINGVKGDVLFEYGLTHMRQLVSFGGEVDNEKRHGRYTRYYSEDGTFEVTLDHSNGSEKSIIYIGGSPYESNIIYIKDFNEDSEGSYKFLHKDYLGSILAISDEKGDKLEQRHYDAWGNLTHLQIRDNEIISDPDKIEKKILLIDRGYTSHEHFQEVGIIHMNGRLYDPLLRRFLNADENIQDPYNTQNYNKYGYVLNNPLMYNDPSGEFVFAIFAALPAFWGAAATAAVIGATVGLASYTIGLAVTGNLDQWNIGGALKATLFGAISGAATFGLGELFAAGKVVQALGGVKFLAQAAAHGVSQGVLSALQGGDFLQGFASGALGSLGAEAFGQIVGSWSSSTGGQIFFGALSGGVGAELTGGNFWQGAAIGGIVAGLNHVMHKMGEDPKFFKKMKDHYEKRTGEEITLTEKEFKYLVSKGKIDTKTIKIIDKKNNIYKAVINFYDSGFDLANTFGKATVTYRVVNGKKLYRTFYDKYDFDPKEWGVRSNSSEIKTRLYNIYSSGKAFEIKFDQNYLVK